MTIREVHEHAKFVSKKFGLYNVLSNNCQTWNNGFLELFESKRETYWDIGKESIVVGAFAAVATSLYKTYNGPKMLKKYNYKNYKYSFKKV